MEREEEKREKKEERKRERIEKNEENRRWRKKMRYLEQQKIWKPKFGSRKFVVVHI